MAHTIYWVDGWVGGSKPPWRGEVERIVSHKPLTVSALKDRAEAMGSRARTRLQTIPRSRTEAEFESEGTLSIEVRHKGDMRNGKQVLLDSSVHLAAKGRGNVPGDYIAMSAEFGHESPTDRYTSNNVKLAGGRRIEGLGILSGSARSMGRKTWRLTE